MTSKQRAYLMSLAQKIDPGAGAQIGRGIQVGERRHLIHFDLEYLLNQFRTFFLVTAGPYLRTQIRHFLVHILGAEYVKANDNRNFRLGVSRCGGERAQDNVKASAGDVKKHRNG